MSFPVSQVMQSMAFQPAHAHPSDGQLLERFIDQKDDTAFAMLMNRHGRMLFAMARRLVNNPADADDVCQAAFLILARKAPQLERQRSVASWLVGVVRKLSADVRKLQERRIRHEHQSSTVRSQDPSLIVSSMEISQQIDEALARLPRKYREPLLLCYWEGLSKPEATARLGWKPGTFSGRLARGKSLLKLRLERKGIIPGVILAWFSGVGQSQALPTYVATTAARQALLHLPGVRLMASATIYQLVKGGIRSMFLSQVKWAAACLVAASCLVVMGSGVLSLAQAHDPAQAGPGSAPSVVQSAKTDQEKIQGKWHCVAVVLGGSTPEEARKNSDTLRDGTWMEFNGDTIRLSGSPSETNPAKFQLLTNVSPKQLVIDADGMKLRGIYTLDDGLLVVRVGDNAPTAMDLPKSFALGQKSSGILFVMQRERSSQQGNGETKAPLGAMAESTALAVAKNHMKQIGVAVHNYANDHNCLPTNVYDQNGKAILSWRVKLLPYLEMDALAKKFKMDEPWDSPHNKELLKLMPEVYQCPPLIPSQKVPYTTPIRAFMGKDTLHEVNKKMNFPDITDGTSNTFLFVEATKAVPWTSPDDLQYDPNKPFPAVGRGFNNKQFLAIFCDGSLRSLPWPNQNKPALAKEYFKMITPAGGEVVDFEAVKP